MTASRSCRWKFPKWRGPRARRCRSTAPIHCRIRKCRKRTPRLGPKRNFAPRCLHCLPNLYSPWCATCPRRLHLGNPLRLHRLHRRRLSRRDPRRWHRWARPRQSRSSRPLPRQDCCCLLLRLHQHRRPPPKRWFHAGEPPPLLRHRLLLSCLNHLHCLRVLLDSHHRQVRPCHHRYR